MRSQIISAISSLLLLVCCTGGGVAFAENVTQANMTIALFAPGIKKVFGEIGQAEQAIDVKFINLPCFIRTDGLIVALASASYTENDGKYVNIMARYIVTGSEANWVNKVTEGNGKNWATQLILHNTETTADRVFGLAKFPVAIVSGNKIYLLVVNYYALQNIQGAVNAPTTPQCNISLTVGEFRSSDIANGAGKTIEWSYLAPISANVSKRLADQLIHVIPAVGSAYSAGDKGVAFVIRVVKNKKPVFAHIRLTVKGNETEWDLTYFDETNGCAALSFFQWEGKILMLPSGCYIGAQRMKESADMGETWTDAVGPITRQWDMLKHKKAVITTVIENKSVLLFTRLNSVVIGGRRKHKLYLWVSDGTRVHPVKTILSYDTSFDARGLLYIKGKLFSLYHKLSNNQYSIFLTRHKYVLKRVKFILAAWNKTDEYLSRPCNNTIAPQGVIPRPLCRTPVPTDGLVSFLSAKASEGSWHDEYLHRDAVVSGWARVANGLTFSGPGAGAKWPLGTRKQARWYNFAAYGLTVAATVTIHGVPDGGDRRPMLTVGVADVGGRRPGLWYDRNKTWRVMHASDTEATAAGSWVANREHRAVLTLWNNSVTAYIDGDAVGASLEIAGTAKKLPAVRDIFIGGYVNDGDVESTDNHVTVTDVLLYNRILSNGEIKALGRDRHL